MSQGGQGAGLESPAAGAFAITPNDSTALAQVTRGIYIGSIGGGATMTVITVGGDTVQFAGLTAGSVIPVRATHVKSTGTAASSLVGLY